MDAQMDAVDKTSDARLIGATVILAISWLSGLTSPSKINKLPNLPQNFFGKKFLTSKMDPDQIFLQASILAAVFGHVAFFFNIWELERYDYWLSCRGHSDHLCPGDSSQYGKDLK